MSILHRGDDMVSIIIAPDDAMRSATPAEPLPYNHDDIAIGYLSDRREIACSLASCKVHVSSESAGVQYLEAPAQDWPAWTDEWRWALAGPCDDPREVDDLVEPREPVVDLDPERLDLEGYVSCQMIAYRAHNSEAANLVADHLAGLLSEIRALGSPADVREFEYRRAEVMGCDDRDLGPCDPADDYPDEWYRYGGGMS